jgi:hypothetical protein
MLIFGKFPFSGMDRIFPAGADDPLQIGLYRFAVGGERLFNPATVKPL